MSSEELTEWMAVEKITGPFGRKREDIQAATIAATMVNTMKGKGRKAKISDFLIPYEKRRDAQDPRDMLKTIKSINKAAGGTERGTDGDA